jgi:hypothetical protein
MTVWLANYPIATDNNAAYNRQRDLIKSAIQIYGTDHVGGITVGNEFMLKCGFSPLLIDGRLNYMYSYLNANGAAGANSAIGNAGAALLVADITDTRDMLGNLGLSKIPRVGTSDAGSYFNSIVLKAVDYGVCSLWMHYSQKYLIRPSIVDGKCPSLVCQRQCRPVSRLDEFILFFKQCRPGQESR